LSDPQNGQKLHDASSTLWHATQLALATVEIDVITQQSIGTNPKKVASGDILE
jgi:hypothetical protein